MSTRTKQTVIALTGAVAVAFGAYALGTQNGGGSAGASGGAATTGQAASSGAQQAHFGVGHGGPGRFGRAFRGGPDRGLADLASRLGVSTAALRSALADVRNQVDPGNQDPRQRLAGELATALGLPTARVQAALRPVVPDRFDHRDPFSGAVLDDLAKALNLDPAKVKATFARLRANGRPDGIPQIATALGVTQAQLRTALRSVLRPHEVDPFSGAVLGDLAKALNLDPAKVKATFARLRANGRPDGVPQIAKALGVSENKLASALRSVLPDRRDHGRPGDRFAADLAKALNVDVAKVRTALQKLRAQESARFQQRQDAFVSALAKRLNLSEAKVRQALAAGFGRRHGP